jgi:uncharacterized protein (DUF1330 family)
MSAYMIVIARIHDRERFMADYAQDAAAMIERYGGRYLARGPGVPLENVEPGAAVVISEWPDAAAIRAFWDSAEYAELKRKRLALADAQVLLVGG